MKNLILSALALLTVVGVLYLATPQAGCGCVCNDKACVCACGDDCQCETCNCKFGCKVE